MNKLDQAVVTYGNLFQTSIIVIMEEAMIAILIYVLWVWLLMVLLKPFRTNRNGNIKDGSVFVIFFVVIVALISSVMTNIIYFDIKRALFGTINFSYTQALFS